MEELLKKIEKYILLLKNVQTALKNIAKGEPDPNKHLIILEKEIKKIEKFKSEYKLYEEIPITLSSVFEDINKEIEAIQSDVKTKFGSQLDSLLHTKGFNLSGNYPNYQVSFFTIKIHQHQKKAEIFYGPEFESLVKSKIIPEDVANTIFEEYEKITQRLFNEEEYLRQLLEAYTLSLQRMNVSFGSEVPIGEINCTLAFLLQPKKFRQNPKKSTYSEYDRVYFSYDLSRLKTRRIKNYEMKLITATRAQTRNRYDFIWIPLGITSNEGKVISGLKFVEVV